MKRNGSEIGHGRRGGKVRVSETRACGMWQLRYKGPRDIVAEVIDLCGSLLCSPRRDGVPRRGGTSAKKPKIFIHLPKSKSLTQILTQFKLILLL